MRILNSLMFWFIVTLAFFISIVTAKYSSVLIFEEWWGDFYDISFEILIGVVVSFIFYFLVVFIPENRKRKIVKGNFTKLYRQIKMDIIRKVLWYSIKGGRTDIDATEELVEKLLDPKEFRELFKDGKKGNEGFYAFRNHISSNPHDFKSLILEFKYIAKQVDYLLHNYSISNQTAFDFLKTLELILLEFDSLEGKYEEEKSFSGFIWHLLSGRREMAVYGENDAIENIIKEI